MVREDILQADKEVRALSVAHLWTAFIEAFHELAEHGVQFSYRASLLKKRLLERFGDAIT